MLAERPFWPRPLSTQECATFMDVTTDYIRGCIEAGELRAECIRRPGHRPMYRIHQAEFRRFLVRTKFARLPPAEARA